MRPLMNLDELSLKHHESGPFKGSYGVISDKIGAKRLGYNLTVCPPGHSVCPFHNHHVSEEMFFILEGEGVLRFGPNEYPLRKHDVIACPPGNRDVAHQIINTGTVDLRYLALSTRDTSEVAEYPDSDKIGVMTGDYGNRDVNLMFRSTDGVDYLSGK